MSLVASWLCRASVAVATTIRSSGCSIQPHQGRNQVAERFAGAGARLDQQMPAGVERGRDRVGHLDLARPLAAADGLDGVRQHLAVVRALEPVLRARCSVTGAL